MFYRNEIQIRLINLKFINADTWKTINMWAQDIC